MNHILNYGLNLEIIVYFTDQIHWPIEKPLIGKYQWLKEEDWLD